MPGVGEEGRVRPLPGPAVALASCFQIPGLQAAGAGHAAQQDRARQRDDVERSGEEKNADDAKNHNSAVRGSWSAIAW